MKYSFVLQAIMLSCLSALLFSCKKESETINNNTGFSQQIQHIVPQAIVDSMRSWGLTVNEGKNPPIVQGIYDLMPNRCTFDNSGSGNDGNLFSNYRLRFHDQDNQNLSIALDYKNLNGGDSATGVGSFLSGHDDVFTIFAEAHGVEGSITYTQIGFYTGKKTNDGIKDFQMGFYLKDKSSDPSGDLIPVGSCRIFKDDNGLSAVTDVYKLANHAGVVAHSFLRR